MNDKIRVIFMGTPDFGVPALRLIIEDDFFDVVAVISQEDKKVGRKQEVRFPAVKECALEYDIPVFQPRKVNDFVSEIRDLKPDVIVVIAYGQIISKELLEIPKFACVNVHGSLLPKYRGSSCIQYPLINGDKETGITVMQMGEGLDTGPILSQLAIDIEPNDTTGVLFDKLSNLGADLVVKTLKGYVRGEIRPVEQDDSKSSYVRNLKKSDGIIDWNKSAVEIERFVRAMTPWPSAFTKMENGKMLKILEVENNVLEGGSKEIGEICVIDGKLAVQCGEDLLVVNKLQVEGKKPVEYNDFIRGYDSLLGTVLD